MLETSARLLRLLTALQSRRFWPGPDLAEHLEVTTRTLRRDVERLRGLGYGIEATSGPGGGYQLGRGAELPPLCFDEEEAVAITAALADAADTASGAGDPAMRALLKLDQLLPTRLRARASALASTMLSLGRVQGRIDPAVLVTLAAACRDRLALRMRYQGREGAAGEREVEPLRLVHSGNRRWYLVAFDPGRGEWRTFRVDRIQGTPRLGARLPAREPPADLEAYVSASISVAPYAERVRVRVRGDAAALREKIPPWCGRVEPGDRDHCTFTVGAHDLDSLAAQLVLAGVDFDEVEPPAVAEHLARIGERLLHACGRRAPATRARARRR